MKIRNTPIGICLLLMTAQLSYAQSNKEAALAKAKEAIRIEDSEGKFDEALKLLDEARKLDPENINYPYEMAYAHISKKEYQQAEVLLKLLLTHKNVRPDVFQQLGNVYDYLGLPDKALETYQKGLKDFPTSGPLYLEMGNVKLNQKKYAEALPYYEKGIQSDPKFPSNYYWASRIYCSSTEEVWGMVYGEIFMNLERNSERTAEISKLLFDTYKSEITFNGDTASSVSFSKNIYISTDDLEDKKNIKLPFGVGCYEIALALSIIGETQINLSALNRIRNNFIITYFKKDFPEKYPNILFDYQKKIKDAGHIEAYNYWILMKGDENEFDRWHANNEVLWDSFIKWFKDNPLTTDTNHKFYRAQY